MWKKSICIICKTSPYGDVISMGSLVLDNFTKILVPVKKRTPPPNKCMLTSSWVLRPLITGGLKNSSGSKPSQGLWSRNIVLLTDLGWKAMQKIYQIHLHAPNHFLKCKNGDILFNAKSIIKKVFDASYYFLHVIISGICENLCSHPSLLIRSGSLGGSQFSSAICTSWQVPNINSLFRDWRWGALAASSSGQLFPVLYRLLGLPSRKIILQYLWHFYSQASLKMC